jgi:hypothetical protein
MPPAVPGLFASRPVAAAVVARRRSGPVMLSRPQSRFRRRGKTNRRAPYTAGIGQRN